MENATKALLISAGVLIAVMILSLLLLFYNQISDYYAEKHKNIEIDQLTEFNKKFENYHREKIRGSDMISLMNRIIDYNANEHFQSGTNYKRIMVNIQIGSSLVDQFKYEDDSGSRQGTTIVLPEITNSTGNERINDKDLIAITATESDLIQQAQTKGLGTLTSSQLQSLSANISNIMINETATDSWDIRNRVKRIELIKSILKIDIAADSENAITANADKNKVEEIKKIALQYYQYTQFKRAYFDCTEVQYDEKTGRICEMNFIVRTNSSGMVEFN